LKKVLNKIKTKSIETLNNGNKINSKMEKTKMTQIVIRLTMEEKEQLKKRCKQSKMTMTDLVKKTITL
jgi:hypothetical protein